MKADLAEAEGAGARRDTAIIWLVLITIMAVVAWMCVAELARVVRAEGRIVTATSTRIVQNLEGGIVVAISVAEGDRVQQGQELMRLDPTRFAANVAELEQKISALEIRRARLEAEAQGAPQLVIPATLARNRPGLARSEMLVFDTRRRARQTTIDRLDHSIGLRREEVAVLEPRVATRAVSELQLLNARLALSELLMERDGFTSDQDRAIAAELSEIVAEIDVLQSTLRSKRHQLDRTIIRAPAAGIVHQLFFQTPGTVVGPGEPILEIVPAEDHLLVEARVLPKDIGHVAIGLEATIKVTAYDYSVHGTLTGRVVRVGADTVADPVDPRLPHAFLVSVEIDQASEDRWLASGLELRNGLRVTAELQAQKTTVIDYVLRPVLRAKEALQEL
ncbi:MAG: HlyD family efflux transporter periplasmic adaptor subunit [Rhodobacteraceae bacterium]|nr:HlyD family efflux transporter periplasmic adaptor subunit [Paracoccaceae bacterium]